MLKAERQSAWMSKITNNGLTQYELAQHALKMNVPIWQQWASKG